MSSTTADTYPESVGSCRPPTPPTSPPPHPAPAAAPRGAPVRRQLDFADADADADTGAGAGGDLDDYDDFLIRAVDDIERGYNEAKRRARPCICGRGDCAVQRDDKRGGWMYVCSSQPKCKYVAMCVEVDQNPQSPPAVGSDPNPCVFSIPRTPVDEAITRINIINPQGAGATTPVNVSPQAAVARTQFNDTLKGVGTMTPVHVSPQGARALTPDHVNPQGTHAMTPVHVTPQGARTLTPVHVSAQGAHAMTPVHVNPQGARALTPVHVSPQGAHAMTPVHVSPQGAHAMAPVHVSPQGAHAMAPVHVSPQGARAMTPVHVSPQGAHAMTPVLVRPQGAGTTAAVKVSPQWHRSNDGLPICHCTAGECKILRVGNEDCYVCPIPKGQGACSFMVPVTDAVKGAPQIGDYSTMEAHSNTAVRVGHNKANGSANPAEPNDDEWPFDIIDNEIVPKTSPSTPRQPVAMARTPTASPMTPFGSRSPMTPRPNSACHGCGEMGHWIRDCPKPSPRNRCFHCGIVGHWQANCPQRRGS